MILCRCILRRKLAITVITLVLRIINYLHSFTFVMFFFSLNIHTLPSYQLLKFQFSLKSLGIEILHPFGISDSLSWGELGYYLELHSEDFSLECGQSGHS